MKTAISLSLPYLKIKFNSQPEAGAKARHRPFTQTTKTYSAAFQKGCLPRAPVDANTLGMLIRMIALRRLPDDTAGSATLSRMLAGSAEATQPTLGILFVKRRACHILFHQFFRRPLLRYRPAAWFCFLGHNIFLHSEIG